MSLRNFFSVPILLTLAVLLQIGCSTPTPSPPEGERRLQSHFDPKKYEPIEVIPEPLPAIEKFPIKSVPEAKGLLTENELVLGVVVNEKARAYPINTLTGPEREIFNDSLGNRAIAATW